MRVCVCVIWMRSSAVPCSFVGIQLIMIEHGRVIKLLVWVAYVDELTVDPSSSVISQIEYFIDATKKCLKEEKKYFAIPLVWLGIFFSPYISQYGCGNRNTDCNEETNRSESWRGSFFSVSPVYYLFIYFISLVPVQTVFFLVEPPIFYALP